MSIAKKKAKDDDWYKRMMEAKRLKKLALEQKQLHAEFEAHPELYAQPVIIKTEAEQRLDIAFNELKEKMHKEHPTQKDLMEQAFNDIARKAAGL